MKTDNKQLALLDYCLPDYFSGYHLPVIQVPVYESMTNIQVSDSIKEEYMYYYDHIDQYYDNMDEFEQLLNKYCDELEKDKNAIFVEVTSEEKKEIEEYESPAYLYFSIINPVYKYGIMFLNP